MHPLTADPAAAGESAVATSRARFELARELMDEFASGSGLEGGAPPRRYLWTDAFAVCNFLDLHARTGEGRHLDRALRLVDQVHHVLGRHRPDDARRGWISGLADDAGELHPTCGGLRIGKPRPERRPDEPFDARAEWDRDGQYLHYLTQWMHALARVGAATGQPVFRRWAVELAQTAQARFTRRDRPGAPPRMVWKMSIDLRRVLVPSSGQHDPLDAWIAYLELAAAASANGGERSALAPEIAEAEALCAEGRWETDDALGLGALGVALFRLARLVARDGVDDGGQLVRLAAATRFSLERFARSPELAAPAASRLAFRELGLALGLRALERVDPAWDLGVGVRGALAAIAPHRPLAARIADFWCEPGSRRAVSWRAHGDINAVMLATALAPDGYLGTP